MFIHVPQNDTPHRSASEFSASTLSSIVCWSLCVNILYDTLLFVFVFFVHNKYKFANLVAVSALSVYVYADVLIYDPSDSYIFLIRHTWKWTIRRTGPRTAIRSHINWPINTITNSIPIWWWRYISLGGARIFWKIKWHK